MGSQNKPRALCSNCQSPFLRRSRTRISERPLRLVGLRPYRCRDCGYRQYGAVWHARTPERPLGDYRPKKRANVAGMLRYAFLLALVLVGTAATVRFRQPLGDFGRSALATARASWFRAENTSAAPIWQTARKQPKADSPEPSADSPETTADEGNLDAAEEAAPTRSASHDDTRGAASEAVRAPHPTLPAQVQSRITSDNTVAVRMRINRSGKVIRATVASASGPESSSVAHYAVATAYRWRFRPTRENGKAVQTEKVVEFLFRP